MPKKSKNQQTGDRGETLAASYLQDKGYIILERNYRCKRAEIDIIAKRYNVLIFVEVKTRQKVAFGFPEDAVDHEKAAHIIEAASAYIIDADWQGSIRFDIVSVVFEPEKPRLRHFKDAFY